MTTYHYSNTSVQTVLSAPAGSGDGTITIGDATGLPGSFPYSIIVDYGASTVEVMTVTAAASTTLTVTRGQDGTSAQSHALNAVVVHGVVARDLADPQTHMAASTNVHGVGSTAAVVGTDTSQTLTNKTISGASNTLSSIGDSSITALSASKLTGNFNGGSAFVSAADATVPLTATGTATASGDLFEAKKGSTVKFAVDPNGATTSQSSITATTSVTAGTSVAAGTSVTATTAVTAGTTVTGQGTGDVVAIVADVPNANTSDLAQFKRNSSVKAKIDKDGNATTANVTAVNVTASGTLGVTGNATVGGTLGITGTTTAAAVNATAVTTSSSLTLGSSTFTIDGVSQPRNLVASGSLTSGAVSNLSSEKVLVTVGSVTFTNGRAYKIEYGGYATISTASAPIFYFIKDAAGGTTYFTYGAGASMDSTGDYNQHGVGYVKNSSGSNVTRTIKLTASGSANHTFRGSSTQPGWVKIWDVGAATDHAEAIQI